TGFGARQTLDGHQLPRFQASVDGGMENVRRDVNHVASRNGLPPLAIDVDHLVALAGNDVEDLFTTRVIVALVSFARLEQHYSHGKAACVGHPRLAHPLDGAPIEHHRLDVGRSHKAKSGKVRHKSSLS